MCGIAGYIGNSIVGEERIQLALDSMKQRGPNAQAFDRFQFNSLQGVFLHARLSIIDLDERANQPYQFDDCTLVFNGEIYNYLELRKELYALGFSFETDSDTEVLIKAYRAFGEDCVDRFEGMWAFALFDKRKGSVLLSRDRFAEKPLYYHRTADGIFFASEIRQIKLLSNKHFEPNLNQVHRYLVNGHKALNKRGEGFYLGIDEVGVGCNLRIDSSLKTDEIRYWKPSFNPQEMDEVEAISKIRSALTRSVELRMRADVPLAFCLSGGVDSSAMASIASKSLGQEIETFSIIDKDPRYNELENIQATVDDLGCKHHLIELDPSFNYLDRLEKLIEYRDSPVATISYLVHSRLIEAMSQHGFKVSISGTGADELFTGYYDHFLLQLPSLDDETRSDRIKHWYEHPAKQVRNPMLQDVMRFVNDPDFRDHIYLNNDLFAAFLNKPFEEQFEEQHYTSDLLRNRMMNELFHEVVRVILKEDDANSMYYSIENRSPFLDRQLYEVAYSIPTKLLIQKGFNKYLLREAMDGILNDTVRLSREKKGFNASLESVIDFNNAEHRAMILDKNSIYDWIDRSKIEALMKQPQLTNSYKKFFFNFLNVKLWMNN